MRQLLRARLLVAHSPPSHCITPNNDNCVEGKSKLFKELFLSKLKPLASEKDLIQNPFITIKETEDKRKKKHACFTWKSFIILIIITCVASCCFWWVFRRGRRRSNKPEETRRPITRYRFSYLFIYSFLFTTFLPYVIWICSQTNILLKSGTIILSISGHLIFVCKFALLKSRLKLEDVIYLS